MNIHSYVIVHHLNKSHFVTEKCRQLSDKEFFQVFLGNKDNCSACKSTEFVVLILINHVMYAFDKPLNECPDLTFLLGVGLGCITFFTFDRS